MLGAELFKDYGATGMVLVVVRGGQVFFQGYGEAVPNSPQPPAGNSLVRLCSLTKIFTTDLLVKLILDKTVRLDDTLQKYAPPHRKVPRRNGPITLLQLATHTSGLPRELGNGPKGTAHFTFPDFKTRWRWLPGQHLQSTPGTAALYSNVGYDFLSDALQSAARKPYATLLSERTLKPLRMYETTFFPTAEQCSRLLKSSWDDGPCTSTENTAGSSGLYSTPADMAIWLKYLLGTGGPAIPEQDASAQASYLSIDKLANEMGLDHAGHPTSIGLGWLHLGKANDPVEIVQKTGGGAGFATYIAINQALHTAVFLAATDGPKATGFNPFEGANNLLLTLAGLPLPAEETPKPRTKPAHKRRRR